MYIDFLLIITGDESMKITVNGMVILALMMTAGCSSKSVVKSTDVKSTDGNGSQYSSTPISSSQEVLRTGYGFDKWQNGPLGDVFFDFDSANLSNDAQEQLKQNSAWLGSNPTKKALIEGHCDSRGTSEYNLALGERRAASAKKFLVTLGVKPNRIESVSFGSEKPFDLGQNDEAWAKNRRDHFIVK